MNQVNLAEKLATFAEPWQPRTVGQFNGHDLMEESCESSATELARRVAQSSPRC
jgi:hypothetical protein